MAMTQLPPPPSRQDPNNFAARADALLAALLVFVTEANALQVDVDDKQATASAAAATATTKAGEAASSRDIALACVNYKGPWSAQVGALAIPATVYHSGSVWMLTQSVANVALETPGVSAKWINVSPANGLGSAAYANTTDFQPAIGALAGLLSAGGNGTISAATAAQIVAAIGVTAVANATQAARATAADSADAIADGAVSSAAKIGNGIITWAKHAAMRTARLIGRTAVGDGEPEEIAIGSGLSLANNTLACTVVPPVTSVGGNAGAVTNAQLSASVAAALGYTPANPATFSSYVAKDNGVGIGAMGTISWSVVGGPYSAGSVYSPTTGSWRLLHVLSQVYNNDMARYDGSGIWQRVA